MAAIDLGFRPRAWQDGCFRGFKRFSVLVCHRRAGKTVMAVMRLLDAALRSRRERSRYAYIAPLLKQAKGIAWDYVKHYARQVPGTEINESELWVQFPNGARIRIYGADNPDSLRGLYFDGVVMDELAQMKPSLWEEVVLPTLTDRQGWALFIGTPKGINLFSELYYRALKDPEWFAALFTVYDTDALPPEEIERAKRETRSENVWRQEYLCDFNASAEDALIPIDLVHAASGRHLRPEHYNFAAKVLGVDVGRQGGDRNVVFPRQGLAAFKPRTLVTANLMDVVGLVADSIRRFQPDAVFVDGSGGYGAGVIDRLRQMGHDVIEVQFGGRPLDARFANKRTEMYWGVKEWLEAGGALPDLPGLKVELAAQTYDHANAAGKLALHPKEDIKEVLGFSPDEADGLALTFAFPVAPRGPLERLGLVPSSGSRVEYDPYADLAH